MGPTTQPHSNSSDGDESDGAIVVFGSGPGVGRSVAALFAERGFAKVVLMSRDAGRLARDAEFVRSAAKTALGEGAGSNVSVHEIPLDLGDEESVRKGLQKVDEKLGTTRLEVVLFNAARTGNSSFFSFKGEELENDLRIAIVSLYTVAKWATPRLLELAATDGERTPSFLVTSGMLAKDPFPAMFSLAACKAGQYSLVHSLHKEFGPKGVHYGLIIIGGTVSDESEVTNARNIAEETWKMSRQPRGKQDLEIFMADPAYEEHVKNRER